jgi:hypothetical protein
MTRHAHPRQIDWLRVAGCAAVVAFAVAFWVGVGVLLAVLG